VTTAMTATAQIPAMAVFLSRVNHCLVLNGLVLPVSTVETGRLRWSDDYSRDTPAPDTDFLRVFGAITAIATCG
jgi:hypothetical protein